MQNSAKGAFPEKRMGTTIKPNDARYIGKADSSCRGEFFQISDLRPKVKSGNEEGTPPLIKRSTRQRV